ncbi:hypothetical protein [Bradyrhizobium sp. STM 3809]|uniref:hypothetical protein n=1 Tax=Bradyrhizobium sp. STM 3809 TaxID=551936 RepID=UPI001F0A6437|nr:hypothetical protein [Bradyrhizobium sp. STM 3809]
MLLLAAVWPAGCFAAEASKDVELSLPRPLGPGDTAIVEITLGALGRGQEVSVTTASGMPLGTISPFGLRAGADAGTYALPVPKETIKDGRLSVHLSISQPGGSRTPTALEVRGIALKLAPQR